MTCVRGGWAYGRVGWCALSASVFGDFGTFKLTVVEPCSAEPVGRGYRVGRPLEVHVEVLKKSGSDATSGGDALVMGGVTQRLPLLLGKIAR